MDQFPNHLQSNVINTVTMSEIIDDLRAAEEMIHRFERRYWLSSSDFYALYQQGLLDDGENSEDFSLWAGFYAIKLEREASLQALSHERTAKLRAGKPDGIILIHPIEPVLQLP
ncbi:MAG: hypothetical protein U0350_25425 [Caldilineaceae bacterium]